MSILYTMYSTTVTATVKTSSNILVTNLINIKLFKKKEKRFTSKYVSGQLHNTERVRVERVGIGRGGFPAIN